MMKRIAFGLKLLLIFFVIQGCTPGQKKTESSADFILSESELPDYERNVDHKGLLTALDDRQDESIRTVSIFTIIYVSIAMEIPIR